MSDETTKEINGARPFEERVLTALTDLQTRFTGFENRLAALEAKQHDTKPIWERALAEIVELSRRLDELRGETQSGLRRVERQISVLSKDLVEVRADLAGLDERLPKLEGQP